MVQAGRRIGWDRKSWCGGAMVGDRNLVTGEINDRKIIQGNITTTY